jgi:diguanylate cyclase (GGDEF)-like protein
MVLYSDRGVAVDRVKYSFLVILINSLIKTAGLWLIFYWAITWRLSRPLTDLSNAVSSLDLKADEEEPVLITYPHRDEIGLLVESLNDMRIRLSASHRELEQKVAERTHELEAVNHVLAALSTTDGLTGIANRRRFDEVLENEWKRALRARQPLALLMLDVDLFKSYNDHYGHQAGDEVLRKVARTLETSSRRSSDLAARYGGEEFAVIAADTDAASALRLAEGIRLAIEALGLAHAGSPLGKLTISIGVSVIVPGDAQQPELLVHTADEALYLAKSQERNRVVLKQANVDD